ncbi:hypothetical protein I656_02510 [Geobacillus sp. WSUCF1]|nr:hypothetical protein I656_02510 [Geobacillus sp. WSUCF1]
MRRSIFAMVNSPLEGNIIWLNYKHMYFNQSMMIFERNHMEPCRRWATPTG